ncbi:MAG TPA: glycosyltransferase family 4 protein [Polyangiaceae bacterium]|nr:glycosyltransferase family 4 protein [Polyangiaceae bacterium]
MPSSSDAPLPLRVTMLTGDFSPEQIGGQGIYAYEVARRLAGFGHHVRVYCPRTPERAAFSYPAGLELRFLSPGTRNPLLFSAEAAALRREIVTGSDVLHVNELFGFPLTWRLPHERHALLVSSHNGYQDRMIAARRFVSKLKYPPLIALEGLSYRFADHVFIGSEIERAPMRRLGIADRRIACVPYGVDTERFAGSNAALRAEVRSELGIPMDARVVLFVGRFVERKKPHVVAEALGLLNGRVPNLHGVLVGDGEYMSEVRARIGSATNVHLTGAVPFSSLHRYYAAADVFTLPSVGEGSISLVVLEAASAGLPLVLTDDSSGQSAVFEPGRNGELVELGDARSLAEGLARALERASVYGPRSRAIIQAHFSWEATAAATLAHYQSALHARRARG